MGCNNTENKFRVLKIDRTESKELNVVDDKVYIIILQLNFFVCAYIIVCNVKNNISYS